MLSFKKVICLFFIFINLYASQSFAKQSIIIDTDMNIDDVIAILYLANDTNVTIKAITIAATGLAHCQQASKNLANILSLTKKNISFTCGRARPLTGHHQFPASLRIGADSLLNTAMLLPQVNFRSNQQSALELLKTTLENSNNPVDILAIGPLTNIAELITHYPLLKNKIHRIFIMGGAIDVKGNLPLADKTQTNLVAEWNIYIDPVASEIVFSSGIPITLIPLDLTNQMPIDQHFYSLLKSKHLTPAANYIYQLFSMNKKYLLHYWYFWDPLAAVIATKNSLATCITQKIRIVTRPENISGRTIIDNQNGTDVDVCTTVNKNIFISELINTLNK